MNQANSALNFTIDQYRYAIKLTSVKGIASVLALTAGTASTYAYAAGNGDAILDTNEWLEDLKGRQSNITISGVDTDKGTNGKYANIHIQGAGADGAAVELKSQDKLLIEDTKHKYDQNYFAAGANESLSITGEGSISVASEVVQQNQSKVQPGLLVKAEQGGSVDIDVDNIDVQSRLIIATTAEHSSASVAANNIRIGNDKSFVGTDGGTYGRAFVSVGDTHDNFDGKGSANLGHERSNISVQQDGKLIVYASHDTTVNAANVSIDSGVLSFEKASKGQDTKSTYQATNTNVNDGFVVVQKDSNATISGGKFNVNGNSNFYVGGKLTVDGGSVHVDNNSIFAAANGTTNADAQILVKGTSGHGSLNLEKAKLKEFLTGLREDGKTAVTYIDESDYYSKKDPTPKTAAQGSVVLDTGGSINFTDAATVELADDKLQFSAQEEAGKITVKNGGAISAKSMSVSKNIANADKLSVEANDLSLGSENFDSKTTKLGINSLFAKNVTFNPKSGDDSYTLQDDLYLHSESTGNIKGNVTVSGGRISISAGNYSMESGKDLVISKGKADAVHDNAGQNAGLVLSNANLAIRGKLETASDGGIYLNNSSLDASSASAYKIAAASVELDGVSKLKLDGSKVVSVNKDGKTVDLHKDFSAGAIKNPDSSSASTIELSNTSDMTLEQFADLKQKVDFKGFFDGFKISDVQTKPQMDIGAVVDGTPDNVYHNTQVTANGSIDKSVSVGNVSLTGNTSLSFAPAGGDGSMRLTNANANGAANNFIQTSGGKVAGVNLSGARASIHLQGSGNIGDINGAAANDGELIIGSVDGNNSGTVNVKGSIGAKAAVGSVNVLKGSKLNVEGTAIKTQDLNIAQGSSLNAQKASITISAGSAASSAHGSSHSQINGDINAQELIFDGAGSHMIAGEATVTVDKFKGTQGATIQVGDDSKGGLGGTVIAKTLDLNGAELFVDPEFGVKASYTIAENLQGGTLNGKATVGKNSVVAIGFKNEQDVVSIIKSRLDANGGFVKDSNVHNALVLNKPITLSKDDKLTLDPSALTPSQGTDAVTLAKNSAIVVTDQVFGPQYPGMTRHTAAITLADQSNKNVKNDGGMVLLSGNFNEKDANLKIFSGGTISGTPITVQSVNGLLTGTIDNNSGQISKLTFQSKEAEKKFANVSKPVRDLLESNLKGTAEITQPFKSGVKFISEVATSSKDGKEADAILHALPYTGAYQATFDTVQVVTDAMYDRASVIASSKQARRTLAANESKYKTVSKTGNNYTMPVFDDSAASGVWVTPVYKNTKASGYDAEGASYGSDINLSGVTIGADLAFSDFSLGIAASAGTGEAKGTGNGEGYNDEFDYYGFGLYSALTLDNLSVIADGAIIGLKNEVIGQTGMPNFGRVGALSATLGVSAGLTTKYRFETPYVDITPHFSTRFYRMRTESSKLYSEVALAKVMETEYDYFNMWSIPIGVNFAKQYDVGGWIINPDLDLTMTFNTGDNEIQSETEIFGYKDKINMSTQIVDDVTYKAQLGLGITNGHFNSNLYVNYTGSEHTDSFGVNANVGYNF